LFFLFSFYFVGGMQVYLYIGGGRVGGNWTRGAIKHNRQRPGFKLKIFLQPAIDELTFLFIYFLFVLIYRVLQNGRPLLCLGNDEKSLP